MAQTPSKSKAVSLGWLAPVLLIEAALLAMVLLGVQRDNMPAVIALYTVAFAGMLWAYRQWSGRIGIGAVIGCALVFRLTMLTAVPDLSDDHYRYLWDGHLVSHGVNPYRYTPDQIKQHNELAGLAASYQGIEKINRPHLYTVYPPVSQLVFGAAGWATPYIGFNGAFVLMKAIYVLLEMLGILLIGLALRRSGQAVSALMLYAWNPLAIVELAGQGHSEAAMIFGFGLAIYAVHTARPAASWVGLSVAGLAKLVPFALVPLWLKFWRGRRAWVAVAVVTVLAAPFWYGQIMENVGGSLRLYTQSFEFNAGLYYLLKSIVFGVSGLDASKVLGPALLLMFLIIAVLIVIRANTEEPGELTWATMALISAYLICATTVHPWYALWVLALVPVTPLLRRSWLWFSWACFFTYLFYEPWYISHYALAAFSWSGFVIFALIDLKPVFIEHILRRRGQHKARQIAPHVIAARVLDLGAGEGFVGRALKNQSARELDIELADVEPMNQTDLPFTCYDGHSLPFDDDQFDTVVLSLVLHHCQNPSRVIEEATRVTRRRVVVTESTFETPGEHRLIRWLDKLANRQRSTDALRRQEEHLQFHTVDYWKDLFAEHGLFIVDVIWLNRFVHKHVLFVLNTDRPGEPQPQAIGGPEANAGHPLWQA